jgi:predicted protein tyrosine phosphatase
MAKRQNYLFVCYANENRSPTAEDVCRKIARANDLHIEASSAGISRGADRPFTKEMADKADKIFVMEEDMRITLVQDYEQNAGKIICLDIPDVYNRDDPILIHILEGKLYEFLAGEGLL